MLAFGSLATPAPSSSQEPPSSRCGAHRGPQPGTPARRCPGHRRCPIPGTQGFRPLTGRERIADRQRFGPAVTWFRLRVRRSTGGGEGPAAFLDAGDGQGPVARGSMTSGCGYRGPLEQQVSDRAREIGVAFVGSLRCPNEPARSGAAWTSRSCRRERSGCRGTGATGHRGDAFRVRHRRSRLRRDTADDEWRRRGVQSARSHGCARTLRAVAEMVDRAADLRTMAREHACRHYNAAVTAERLLTLWPRPCTPN